MVWWRVTLPLILPYLLAGGLFVLVFALADFAVADTLRLRVYPVEVFIELSALFDEAAALRLSLPLLAVMLLLVGLIGWLLRGRAFVSLGGGRAGHELLALGRRRWAALAFCALVIGAAVLLPLGVLLLDAGAPTNYWQALQVSAETILTGIALAVAAALSTTALALGVALSLRALGGGPARVGLDLLSQLPFALAPILLGIGLIKVWNHPATLWLYGSAGMLIVGYLARLAPFAVRILDAALAQVAESQLEAARLAMGGWRLLWWVVLPLLRRGLAATLLLCFVLALGELGLALLITPPGLIPIPIEIYNYLHYGAEERVAALCLILIAAQLGPIALLYPLWQRSAAPTLAQRAER
jgi:iron(III) transport system permease protein